jgi:hypothetical protein
LGSHRQSLALEVTCSISEPAGGSFVALRSKLRMIIAMKIMEIDGGGNRWQQVLETVFG